jgi:hypothetical protein
MYDDSGWAANACTNLSRSWRTGRTHHLSPHIHEISLTHGALIRKIGYHCRDYFLKQWDKYKDISGVLAHSTHVRAWHL